jgi:hypothetical protein
VLYNFSINISYSHSAGWCQSKLSFTGLRVTQLLRALHNWSVLLLVCHFVPKIANWHSLLCHLMEWSDKGRLYAKVALRTLEQGRLCHPWRRLCKEGQYVLSFDTMIFETRFLSGACNSSYVIYVREYCRCMRHPSTSYTIAYYVRQDWYLPKVEDEG